MSTTVVVTLLVNFIFVVPPQKTVTSDTPVPIAVVKASWEKRSFRPGWDASQYPATDGLRDAPTTVSAPDTVMNSNGTQGPPLSTIRGSERREQQRSRRDPHESETSNVAYSPTDRVTKYFSQIKVLNSSAKAIIAIDWEYQFGAGDTEPARHRFQSFQRIKPAGASTLTGESPAPPTRVLNASKMDEVTSRVVVHCVLYADGTATWRVNRTEADCQPLKSHRDRR